MNETNPTSDMAISKELNESIIATTKTVGKIAKETFNKHGGYNYVSIDRYYETVGAIAADHGLSWVLVQDKFSVHPEVGKSGMLEIGYRVDLLHANGAKAQHFSYVSIIHPIMGAQTIGSAISYADKVFARQLFKVATGEPDADTTDTTDLDSFTRNKSQVRDDFLGPSGPTVWPVMDQAISNGEALPNDLADTGDNDGSDTFHVAGPDIIEETVKTFIPDCGTLQELTKFYHENEGPLKFLKDQHPEKHKAVMAMFTTRKVELTTKDAF